jgi:hypothetical protein
LVLAFLMVCQAGAWAVSLDIGIGGSFVQVTNDTNGVDGSSSGPAAFFGFEFLDTWYVDMFASGGTGLATGVPPSICYPPDSADYEVLFLGLHKGLWSLNDHLFTPWIAAGMGLGALVWKTYAYHTSGIGLIVGGGTDLRLGTLPLVVRLQFLFHTCSTTDDYNTDAGTLSGKLFSLLLTYRLRF